MRTHRRLAHQRLERRLEEARRIAELRSGARGKDARTALIRVEAEVAASDALLAEDPASLEPGVVAEATQKAVDMLADVQNALEMVSALPDADFKADSGRWMPRAPRGGPVLCCLGLDSSRT